MPELPEVETTRRSLEPGLSGARIEALRLGLPLRWPLGCDAAMLLGRRVLAVRRRGKYLWLPLGPHGLEGPATPPPGDGLLIHLGMSGALRFGPAGPAGRWDHVELRTDRGVLSLSDPRRFGAFCWSPAMHEGVAGARLAGLGAEPLEAGFDGGVLHRAWRGRRLAVKPALLAGDAVVGVGNIYASEALFEAGIDPRTPAGRISLARCEALAAAVRAVLGRALLLGGSTLRDFHDAHGQDGAFQDEAKVYGRAGQDCPRCGPPARIERLVQAQRASYFCRRCQRR